MVTTTPSTRPGTLRWRALNVPLRPEARAQLQAIAARERRTPRQQAAILLERALEAVEGEAIAR